MLRARPPSPKQPTPDTVPLRRPRRWTTAPSLAAIRAPAVVAVLLACLANPAAAVLIPFENCLAQSYQDNVPLPLQWVPRAVAATFDTADPSHALQVVVWGNVAGSYTNVVLPAPDSPDWADPNKTDGKILREPEPDDPSPRVTTLHSKVNVLTYQPWNKPSDFCDDSLVNGTCPLAPVFDMSKVASPIPYGLPSFNLTNDFYSSYAFTSFSASFLIIYGDSKATDIGCVSATITPDLGGLTWLIRFLPLLVLLFVGFATMFAGIWSPSGTSDIFHWTSNYGRDADLLRLVTPGFGDCLQYIQFAALTGGLSLSYPGFYQPIVSQIGWSSLMFNESFVSKAEPWQSVVDGIYVTNGQYGLQRLAQLVGMANVDDIWAGMIVWLLVIIAALAVLIQLGFFSRWLYRHFSKESEEDLRAKNLPFTLGNIVRIVLNYFLLPIVALSTFQLVVASESPPATAAFAAVTLALIVGFAGWLLYLIVTTRPRAVLFDDLPTVLLYGPLYNTYSDEAAAFALIPVLLTLIRGIAIGAVQPFGIAQVVLLAICEVIQLSTLHAFRPFHSPTSMNAYHTLFSALRFVTVVLMIPFVPSLGVTEGPKGWIGYVILLIHAGVLVLGFFLNALQTLVEVSARMLGAGGDDIRGLTRGGLSKIFGARQLSRRRVDRRASGPSRQSHLSSTAMLDSEEASKAGFVMPSSRVRSESAGSIGVHLDNRHRNSSALSVDNHSGRHRNFDGASSFTPTTPGEASTFSFITSSQRPHAAVTIEAADPYYRPPRRRKETLNNESPRSESHRASVVDSRRLSQFGGTVADSNDMDEIPQHGTAPVPYTYPSINSPHRTDYSTREGDFYYGVRGPALNSDGPGRKLGTGPADPTGPMASAAGWFRGMFGGKMKEKGKGFEVVRSTRMPPSMMARNFGDEAPPEGIPVAMGVLRHGPIEPEDDEPKSNRARGRGQLLDERGEAQEGSGEDTPDGPPTLPGIDSGGSLQMPMRLSSEKQSLPADLGLPGIPRRSSRRHSGAPGRSRTPSFGLSPPGEAPSVQHRGGPRPPGSGTSSIASHLPFERSDSPWRGSTASSAEAGEYFAQMDLRGPRAEERPTSYGLVPHHSISRVDPVHRPHLDLRGSEAEVVDERGSANTTPRGQF